MSERRPTSLKRLFQVRAACEAKFTSLTRSRERAMRRNVLRRKKKCKITAADDNSPMQRRCFHSYVIAAVFFAIPLCSKCNISLVTKRRRTVNVKCNRGTTIQLAVLALRLFAAFVIAKVHNVLDKRISGRRWPEIRDGMRIR